MAGALGIGRDTGTQAEARVGEPHTVPAHLGVEDLQLCPHSHLAQLHGHRELDADRQVPLSQVVHLHRGQRGRSVPNPQPAPLPGCGRSPGRSRVLTWYRSWAPRLPSSSEAEKLRYLVESSWLGEKRHGWVEVPRGLGRPG